jgi:cell division initiation protein
MFQSEDSANPTTVQLTTTHRLQSSERQVSVTPLDMRQTRFGSAMRGFDKSEVTTFLEQAAGDYEQTLRENERLRQQLAALETSVTQYRDIEGSIKNTLMSAQKVADDMREHAQRESTRLVREAEGRAEMLVREAEGRAELLTQKTQARVEDIQREIDELRMKRREVQTSLESCVSTLRSTLDFVREQEDRESRVVQHRPRLEATAQSA